MSPVNVDVSIIDKTATLLSPMDPSSHCRCMVDLVVSHSQPQPKCCSHCEWMYVWMDGWMDVAAVAASEE
jgi:hypothetical protein